MFCLRCVVLAAAIVFAACAPAKGQVPVHEPGSPAPAPAVTEPPASDEPAAPEPKGQCVGSPPPPESKNHPVWPPSHRVTCCYPDKEGIRRVVKSGFPAMKRCYENAMSKGRPDLKGKVVVKFTVKPDGSVSHACDSGSEIESPEMLECVMRVFLRLRFPGQTGELCPKYMTIAYPVVFQAE